SESLRPGGFLARRVPIHRLALHLMPPRHGPGFVCPAFPEGFADADVEQQVGCAEDAVEGSAFAHRALRWWPPGHIRVAAFVKSVICAFLVSLTCWFASKRMRPAPKVVSSELMRPASCGFASKWMRGRR